MPPFGVSQDSARSTRRCFTASVTRRNLASVDSLLAGSGREAQPEIHTARTDRFGEGLLRELHFAGLCVGKGSQQFGGAHVLAIDRGGACFDIGQRRIARGQPSCSGRNRNKQQGRECCPAKKLTCSGNWGLRHLRE